MIYHRSRLPLSNGNNPFPGVYRFSLFLFTFTNQIGTMKIFYLFLFTSFSYWSFCQSVTHGPIVGSVTENSCRVFVRTDAAVTVTVEVSTSASFSSIVSSASGLTDAAKDNIA